MLISPTELLKLLQQSNSWDVFFLLIFIPIAISALWKAPAVIRFFSDRKKEKLSYLEEVALSDQTDEVIRSLALEEHHRESFKRISGISASKKYREKLKSIIERSEGEVTLEDLSKAKDYLWFKEGNVLVRIGILEKAFVAISVVAYLTLLVLALFSLVSFFYLLVSGGLTIKTAVGPFALLFASVVGMFFFVNEYWKYRLAIKIEKTLRKE